MSKLICIRHAQASFGAADYDQLSDLGYQQSQRLGEYLADKSVAIDKVYIGPLKRHRQTFETVHKAYSAKGINLPEPEILDGLAEHRGPEILREAMPQLLQTYDIVRAWHDDTIRNPDKKIRNHFKVFNFFMMRWATDAIDFEIPKHHQSWHQFKTGVSDALQQIISDQSSGITTAAFTSGGTISAIMGYALEMHNDARIIEMNDSVINTSMSEFKYKNGRLTMNRFNLIPHLLSEDLITYV